uniref:Uncharacterized protein n=1 Tax=Lygus hesperus TaxID=30085 RepID=A0A146KZK6_LYGHE
MRSEFSIFTVLLVAQLAGCFIEGAPTKEGEISSARSEAPSRATSREGEEQTVLTTKQAESSEAPDDETTEDESASTKASSDVKTPCTDDEPDIVVIEETVEIVIPYEVWDLWYRLLCSSFSLYCDDAFAPSENPFPNPDDLFAPVNDAFPLRTMHIRPQKIRFSPQRVDFRP